MNADHIEWCTYVEENPDFNKELEFLEWQSIPGGGFGRIDVCSIFRSIIFAQAKISENMFKISFDEACEQLQLRNNEKFYERLETAFKEVPFGLGIKRSELEKIVCAIEVPKVLR